MSRRQDWPRCSELGCTNAVREVAGEYDGPRQPEPDCRCSRHRVTDTEFVPTDVTDDVHSDESEKAALAVDESPATVERISSLRSALRDGLMTEEVAQLVRDQVIEALRAVKGTFVTCGHCKHRVPVMLPDAGTRLNAAMKLMEELEGKMKASWEAREDAIERDAMEMLRRRSELTDKELAWAIAALERELAEEVASA